MQVVKNDNLLNCKPHIETCDGGSCMGLKEYWKDPGIITHLRLNRPPLILSVHEESRSKAVCNDRMTACSTSTVAISGDVVTATAENTGGTTARGASAGIAASPIAS